MTPDPKRWQALAVLGIAYLMVVLDVSIVNVALPSIQKDLDFSTSGLQWVVSGYALTFGGFLLLGGRAGDLLGRRRLFMVGLALVRALLAPLRARVVGGDAHRLPALQGAAGAILSPSVFSITLVTFEEGAERNKALGVLGAIAGSGAAIGVLLGGILTEYAGWEWIFFVNVPIGCSRSSSCRGSSARAALDGLERALRRRGRGHRHGGPVLLVYGLTRAPTIGWTSPRDDRLPRRLGRAHGRVHRHRAALALAARAAQLLPQPHARRART